jgi:hypothetical protein
LLRLTILFIMGSVEPSVDSHAPTRRKHHPTAATIEKDDAELRLEKALFGDDAGFLNSLSAARYGEARQLQVYSDEESQAGATEDDDDLANVADEDVRFSRTTHRLY